MIKKIIIEKNKELLELRKEGRKEAFATNAMQAHGKIMGMDTFSWVNPNMDQLSSALISFPFQIIWISTHQQLKKSLAIEPSLSKSIETVILHNVTKSEIKDTELSLTKNVMSVSTTKEALQLASTLKKEKCVFLFSTEGNTAKEDKEEFEKFIARYK